VHVGHCQIHVVRTAVNGMNLSDILSLFKYLIFDFVLTPVEHILSLGDFVMGDHTSISVATDEPFICRGDTHNSVIPLDKVQILADFYCDSLELFLFF